MYKQNHTAVLIISLIVLLLLNLSIVALTAYVFTITGSAWSFLILLLFGFRLKVDRD